MALKRLISALVLTTCLNMMGQAQAAFEDYQGQLTDTAANTYTLTHLSVAGQTYFRCRIRDSLFTISFNQLQTLSFPPTQTESPYKGYVLAEFLLLNGQRMRAYLNIENYWLEGLEINLGFRLKIPLNEVSRLEIIQPVKSPPPESQ